MRRQICYLSRASGVTVVVSGPPWCQWCSDWCALGCSAAVAFGLRLFVARFWLAEVGEVFAAVRVLLSVVLGRGILCVPLERWGAGRWFHQGIQLQAAAASRAHVSCSGGREPVASVQMQLTRNRHFWGCSQNKGARSLFVAIKGLETGEGIQHKHSSRPEHPSSRMFATRWPCRTERPHIEPHQIMSDISSSSSSSLKPVRVL